MDNTYPREWFTEKDFKIAKNVIEISQSDKDMLYTLTERKDFPSVIHQIIAENQHPFDEVTYFIQTREHSVVADVRNNRLSDWFCVMRIIVDREHIGNLAFDRDSANSDKAKCRVEPFNSKDKKLLGDIGKMCLMWNRLVGYYTLSCHDNRQSMEIGKAHTTVVRCNVTKRKPIKVKDISTAGVFSYIKGNGSKPSHEFGVRGHIRRYKNGKEVFIKPYVKCKGRGKETSKTYTLH